MDNAPSSHTVPPPPVVPTKASYRGIWGSVTTEKPITIMGMKFFLEPLVASPGFVQYRPVQMVEIPVRMHLDERCRVEHPVYDITSTVRQTLPEQEWVRRHGAMYDVLAKADDKYKKRWLAARAAMRKARENWEKKYPEALAELVAERATRKRVKHTQAVMDFVSPLTKARSAIDSMLLAIDRGTYTGEMCADLYRALNDVSMAQKTFRSKCCGGKRSK